MLKSIFLGHKNEYISTPPFVGLVVDFDARFNVRNNGAPSVDAGDVDEWISRNASPYTAEQTKAVDQPIYVEAVPELNGFPAVQFAGDEWLDILNSSASLNLAEKTVFFVGISTPGVTVGIHYEKDPFFVYHEGTGGGSDLFAWVNMGNTSTGVDIPDDGLLPTIYGVRMKKGVELDIKNIAGDYIFHPSPSDPDFEFSNATIGRKKEDSNFKITRLLIYESYLPDAERDLILVQLAQLYQI